MVKIVKSQRGQILVLTALMLIPLVAMVGVAVDSGYLFYLKRTMQTAADSAALAGSLDKNSANSTTVSVTKAAKDDAKLNGFAEDAKTTVFVNTPPTSGSYTSDDYVEVIIQQTNPTFFINVLSLVGATGVDSATVKARAVAGSGALDECIWATNASASPGLSVGGAATIDAPGCGIYVRSSSSSAMSASGSVTAKTIDVVGAATGKGPFSPTPTGGAFALPDPLAGLSAPSLGACVEAPGSGSINPNIPSAPYCSINVSSATFNPGTYYIKGSGPGCTGTAPTLVCVTLKPGTGKTVSGDKVVFFIASGGISIAGKGTVTLSAPDAGTYAGIVFYEAPGNTNPTDIKSPSGEGCKAINGIVYIPSAQISYSAAGCVTAPSTTLVADTISIAGQAQFGNPTKSVKKHGHSHITE